MGSVWTTRWALVLLVGLAACGDADVGAPGHTVVDSAGVAVVESRYPAWSGAPGWTVGDATVVLGGEGVDLFQVAGAARLGDGGAVVADGGTSRLLFFDADGSLRGEAGGAGDGPGEFRIMQAMGISRGDSVWVYDFSHRRVSLHDPLGDVARTLSLDPPIPTAAMVGRWPDGSFAVTQLWGDAGDAALTPGLARDPVLYVRYTAEGLLADTLGSFPGREVLLRPEGRRMTMGSAPFARGASHALFSDGLVVGDQVAHELRVLDLQGQTRRVLRWNGPALGLTAADIDAWKEDQIASAASADRPSVRAYLADVPVPGTRPAYGDLLADSEGCLWVGAYAHPGAVSDRWDVFDARGVWLGPVALPDGFRPLQVGVDWILGLARDDLGVERLEVRELHRRAGGAA